MVAPEPDRPSPPFLVPRPDVDFDLRGLTCRSCNRRPFELYALADDGEHMIKVCLPCLDKVEGETFASPFPIMEFDTEYPEHA